MQLTAPTGTTSERVQSEQPQNHLLFFLSAPQPVVIDINNSFQFSDSHTRLHALFRRSSPYMLTHVSPCELATLASSSSIGSFAPSPSDPAWLSVSRSSLERAATN